MFLVLWRPNFPANLQILPVKFIKLWNDRRTSKKMHEYGPS